MITKYSFKQGFENEEGTVSVSLQLDITTEGIRTKDIQRLVTALEKEYIQLLVDKCGSEERGYHEWQIHHLG